MVIIYGTRLMGKVDQVEALGHVATQFFHLYYVPLIPTGSYLVLSEQGDDFRGVSVPLSFKSVLTAWLRAGTFLGFVVCTIVAIVTIADKRTRRFPELRLDFSPRFASARSSLRTSSSGSPRRATSGPCRLRIWWAYRTKPA